MLNDAICFRLIYIVCGYTELRFGMDRLATLIKAQTNNRTYARYPVSLLKKTVRLHQETTFIAEKKENVLFI